MFLPVFKKSSLFFLLIVICTAGIYCQQGEVVIPGDSYKLFSFIEASTRCSKRDFLYHFNEILLNAEPPNGILIKNGTRNKLSSLLETHQRLKKTINSINKGKNSTSLKIKLVSVKGYLRIKRVLNIIGLDLRKTSTRKYKVNVLKSSNSSNYYLFLGLTCDGIEKQIEATGYFYLILKETRLPLDNKILNLLKKVGGEKDFFLKMVKDEKFSLIFGTCLNMSNNELDYLLRVCGAGFFKKVYKSELLPMGLYILSPVIRVFKGELILPGGNDARQFWETLLGKPLKSKDFIVKLALADEGKFNFLYRTTFFMTNQKVKALTMNYSGKDFRGIMDSLVLKKISRITGVRFPLFRDFNFFCMLNALVVKGEDIYFPVSIDHWYKCVAHKTIPSNSGTNHLFLLLKNLAELNGNGRYENIELKAFTTIYSKFVKREKLLDPSLLSMMFNRFSDSSVLIDYLEKLEIKKNSTAKALFKWYEELRGLKREDRELYTSLFQSIFEIISFMVENNKEDLNYDAVLQEVLKIPFDGAAFTNRFFDMVNSIFVDLNRGNPDVTFLNMICKGIPSRIITVDGQKFLFDQKGSFIKEIREITESQELYSISQFIKMQSLLKKYENSLSAKDVVEICKEIETFVDGLPNPDIAESAPGKIKRKIRLSSRSAILKFLDKMKQNIGKDFSRENSTYITNKVRKNYLVVQLRDYLLGVVYAINAKDSKLKPFINPNLIRLHDFSFSKENSPWNRSEISWEKGDMSCFYIAGGLSRVNLLFAECLKDRLFSLRLVYDSAQITSVLNNILRYYRSGDVLGDPMEVVKRVEKSIEILDSGRTNSSEGDTILRKLVKIAVGNHYRNAYEYFNMLTDDSPLNFSEMYSLGGTSEAGGANSIKFIGMNTFGTLQQLDKRYLPLELTRFKKAGWSMGEFIDELQLKVLYYFGKTKMSQLLVSEVTYLYMERYCRTFFQQNYKGDFFNTYETFDIFSKSTLKNIVNYMKRDGGLKLL